MQLAVKETSGIRNYELYLPFDGFVSELKRAGGLQSSLPVAVSANAPPGTIKVTFEELVRYGRTNFLVFYEGCRTNNTFATNVDPAFALALLRLLHDVKYNVAFLKIVYANKACANACDNSVLNLFKILLQFKLHVDVDAVVVSKQNLSILDPLILGHKKLFESKPQLNLLMKNSDFYKQFLDYYGRH